VRVPWEDLRASFGDFAVNGAGALSWLNEAGPFAAAPARAVLIAGSRERLRDSVEPILDPWTPGSHAATVSGVAFSSALLTVTLTMRQRKRAWVGSFRFRKSIKLGPGVRLNVSKTGVGVSAGVPGIRRSFHSSGRETTSVGLPGTGLGYVQTRSSGGKSTPAPAQQLATKPGLFAPKHEKEFYKALTAYLNGDTERARGLFRSASEKDTGSRARADDLLAGMLSMSAEKPNEAIPHLERVVSSEVELPDQLMTKDGFGGGIKLKVTERVTVEVEWDCRGRMGFARRCPRPRRVLPRARTRRGSDRSSATTRCDRRQPGDSLELVRPVRADRSVGRDR
jgi:hypothetical protein